MKTEFKVGMKVDDGIGVGVVHSFGYDGYPVVTFISSLTGSEYHFHFCDADIEYLKEYKEEQHDTN